MKRITLFTILLVALIVCTTLKIQATQPTAMDMPQANMLNPASVYCTQQVNVLQSILYLVGINLSGYSILKGEKNEFNQ